MRIAVVVNRFPSVSETFIVNKVMGLRSAGADVTVFANGRKAGDLSFFANRFESDDLDFVERTLPGAGKPAFPSRLAALIARDPAACARTWRRAAARYGRTRRAAWAWGLALPFVSGGFDVVHFEYSGLAALYLDSLPLLGPAKVLASCRGAAEQIAPLVTPSRAGRLRDVFSRVDRVHCVSRDMEATVRGYGLPEGKSFVNYPSIDPSRFRRATAYEARERGPFRLVSTGRLHWKKGFDHALLAVRRLVDGGADVRYTIVGGGPEEEKLRFLVSELDLGGVVELAGRRSHDEVRATLESADVYMLPSLSEGLSNAALEAMAMELPVVSTTAGGMSEAIDDGRNGMLVEPSDPAALAGAVRRLLGNAPLRRELGREGRREVERRFSLDRQISVFVGEYERLIA